VALLSTYLNFGNLCQLDYEDKVCYAASIMHCCNYSAILLTLEGNIIKEKSIFTDNKPIRTIVPIKKNEKKFLTIK
jgi:hypothetical protein